MNSRDYNRPVSDMKYTNILEVARTRFLEDGFAKAAMADIADQADVSTATLYKHFASKEILFTAVVMEAANAVHEDFGTIPPGTTAVDFFNKILLDGYSAQMRNRVNDLLRVTIAEVGASPELGRKVFDIVVGGRYRRIQAVLDEMIERGLLKPHDTALGARMALGMLKELFVWPALFEPGRALPEDALAQAQAAIDTYLARYGA